MRLSSVRDGRDGATACYRGLRRVAPWWKGYLHFYREMLDGEVTRRTFERLSLQQDDVFGFVAESFDGKLVRIAHGLLHPSTRSVSRSCYLEEGDVGGNEPLGVRG